MTDEIPRKERRIPEHKIRELVEEWRDRAKRMEDHIEDPNERERCIMGSFRASANELEALLE